MSMDYETNKRQWPLALVLFGLMPGLGLAFYFYAKTPNGAELVNKSLHWLEEHGLGTSIGRQYMTKGVFKAEDFEVVPEMRPQQEGMWLVGPRVDGQLPAGVDTDKLHHALVRATAGQTIRLQEGSYQLPLAIIDRSLTLEALSGAKVTIELLEGLSVRPASADPQAPVTLNLKHVTLHAVRPYYRGANIEVLNATLALKNVHYRGDNHEIAILAHQRGMLEMDQVIINPGERATGVRLADSAQLRANQLSIIVAKEGISSDILSFQGTLQLNDSTIKKVRGNAIALYGGELSSEKLTLDSGQGGLLLRRQAKATLRLSQFLNQELQALDVAENSQLRLMDSQIENAGQRAILVQKNSAPVQIVQTQIHGPATALEMVEQTQVDFVASNISGAQATAVLAGVGSQWTCRQSALTGKGTGLRAVGGLISSEECQWNGFATAIELKKEARFKHLKSSFVKVGKNIVQDDSAEVETLPSR